MRRIWLALFIVAAVGTAHAAPPTEVTIRGTVAREMSTSKEFLGYALGIPREDAPLGFVFVRLVTNSDVDEARLEELVGQTVSIFGYPGTRAEDPYLLVIKIGGKEIPQPIERRKR